MAGFSADLVNLVDARIAAADRRTRNVGTFVQMDGDYAMVSFDGSSLALPCKYLANVSLTPDARVTLEQYGSDWVVTGTFNKLAWPAAVEDLTPNNGFTNTGGTTGYGSPIVQIEFDAPASGSIYMTVGGHISQTTNGNIAVLGYRIVRGDNYDTGANVLSFDYRRGISCGRPVLTSSAAELGATKRWLVTSLDPGAHYIARAGLWTSPAGTANAAARFLMAEPVM